MISIAAANRDPAVTAAPERFDVSREEPRHVAFGYGPHLCLGMTLARLEAKVVFRTLTSRFPRMTLVEGGAVWAVNTLVRGLDTLRVRLR